MIFWIILAFFLGVSVGTFTGLFPGIHINLVAATLLACAGYFSGVEPLVLVVFIVAVAITHTFIDFIPSVFLGAPDEDSFLAVLPGHQLLTDGKGFEAVVLTLYGCLTALPIVLIVCFLFVHFSLVLYAAVKLIIPYVLISASIYLVLNEDEWILSGVVFVLAGFLGLFVFNLPVKDPLLPLLSGLFGVSGLIVSLKSKAKVPRQNLKKLREIYLDKKGFISSTIFGALAAAACSLFPGLGSGHAAIVGSEFNGSFRDDQRNFLFLVGLTSTIMIALSFVTAYTIGKSRSGAAVAVSKFLGQITSSDLIVVIATILLSGIFSFCIGLFLARFFSSKIDLINYGWLSWFVIVLLFVVNLFLTNVLGILTLITASALGVFCIESGVRRIQLMGVLLAPTILYYLF